MKDVFVTDSIRYIGADDKNIDLFESQYKVPNGVSYNSYVILDEKVAVMGGSQGGGLSLVCAGLEPRIAKAAVDYPFLCDYKRVWQLNRTVQGAYSELRCFFRDFDPLHQREEEIFRALGYIDAQNFAPRIRARVLMAIPLMDEICPPSTQFAAYNKITAPKQLCLYPDWGHEYIPTHADLVYHFLAS